MKKKPLLLKNREGGKIEKGEKEKDGEKEKEKDKYRK